MTRVKGLAFASLFVLALSAQPVLSQDRGSNPPPPTNGTNTDAPPANPQNNPTAKPPRQRADGGQHRHRRHSNGDPSQAQSSDGKGSGTKRQSAPPGSPPANQPP